MTLTNKCGILERENKERKHCNLGKEKERCIMINDEICELREKLNKSIENGDDYSIIYNLSVQLDDLIAKFYNEKLKK